MTIGQILKGSKDGGVNTKSGVLGNSDTSHIGLIVRILGSVPVSSETSRDIIVKSTGIIKKTTGINVCTGISSDGSGTSESMDSIGESINSIGVVEGLGT